MRVLIVYDSVYGNTERVAEAIASGLAGEVRLVRADKMDPSALGSTDLLIVGSPTQGGRPTAVVQDLIAKLPFDQMKGMKVAAFDTRLTGRFAKIFGYAADKISTELTAKGASLVSDPQPFFVTGKKGPLKDGESERAVNWAKGITK